MNRRWAFLLRTPTENRRVKWLMALTMIFAPVVIAVHFSVRLVHGDYPSDADGIGIPVFLYVLFVFPLALVILGFGLRCYTPHAFLFAWSRKRFGRSLLWTFVSIPIAWFSVCMFLDGLNGTLYWTSVFFLMQVYCLLALRASLLACKPASSTACLKALESGRYSGRHRNFL